MPCATVIGSSIPCWRVDRVQLITRSEINFPVRHDHFRTVGHANSAGAHADAFDHPGGIVNLYDVADADRALEQQNQAGNKFIENILQAQSNADAEGARNDRDSRHINAQSGQCEKKSCEQNQIVKRAEMAYGIHALGPNRG